MYDTYKKELEKERENINSFEELVSFLENINNNNVCRDVFSEGVISQAALATILYFSKKFKVEMMNRASAMDIVGNIIFNIALPGNKCGIKVISYDDMLYQRNEYKFKNTITKTAFEKLQKAANDKLLNSNVDYTTEETLRHWQSIVDGNVPFGYTISGID